MRSSKPPPTHELYSAVNVNRRIWDISHPPPGQNNYGRKSVVPFFGPPCIVYVATSAVNKDEYISMRDCDFLGGRRPGWRGECPVTQADRHTAVRSSDAVLCAAEMRVFHSTGRDVRASVAAGCRV